MNARPGRIRRIRAADLSLPAASPVGFPAGDHTNRSTTMDEMDKRFARFGAMLALQRWLDNSPTSGFINVMDSDVDDLARHAGLMAGAIGSDDEIDCLPGVVDAARRLAAPPPTDAERLEDLRRKFADMARALGLDVRLGEGVADG